VALLHGGYGNCIKQLMPLLFLGSLFVPSMSVTSALLLQKAGVQKEVAVCRKVELGAKLS
jgi:hypothetical protein